MPIWNYVQKYFYWIVRMYVTSAKCILVWSFFSVILEEVRFTAKLKGDETWAEDIEGYTWEMENLKENAQNVLNHSDIESYLRAKNLPEAAINALVLHLVFGEESGAYMTEDQLLQLGVTDVAQRRMILRRMQDITGS